jgi:hypothetical protein
LAVQEEWTHLLGAAKMRELKSLLAELVAKLGSSLRGKLSGGGHPRARAAERLAGWAKNVNKAVAWPHKSFVIGNAMMAR